MGIVNSKLIYTTTGTAALAAAVIFYYFIRPIGERRPKSNPTLVLGLKNFGYTCYLNSILQALASCEHFEEWIRTTNEIGSRYVVKLGDGQANGSVPKPKKLILNRAAFPVVSILHQSFIRINRVIRGDDDIESSQVPGQFIKVFNQVLNDKFKTGPNASGSRFRLIDTEEQDTHEVFNHLMTNLSDNFGSDVVQRYDKSVQAVLKPNRNESQSLVTESISNGISVTKSSKLDTNDPAAGGDSPRSQLFLGIPKVQQDLNRNLLKTRVEFDEEHPPHGDVSRQNSFQGTSGSQLQCIACLSRRSVNIEYFSSVSLNLPRLSTGTVSLYELFDTYTKPVLVHSVDCDSCSKKFGAPTKSSFYRKSAFAKLPPSLCIHILRTEWKRDGTSYKRKEHVRFPIRLNMTDVLRVNDIILSSFTKRSERKQQRRIDDSGEYLQGVSRYRNSQYILRSVVSHRGDVDSGHFITYRRSPKNEIGEEMWLLVSDLTVIPVTLEEVLTCKAYMLFYEKADILPIDSYQFAGYSLPIA